MLSCSALQNGSGQGLKINISYTGFNKPYTKTGIKWLSYKPVRTQSGSHKPRTCFSFSGAEKVKLHERRHTVRLLGGGQNLKHHDIRTIHIPAVNQCRWHTRIRCQEHESTTNTQLPFDSQSK